MYDEKFRAEARAAIATGESLNSISKRVGVSRAALREWRDNPGPPAVSVTDCPRCDPDRATLPAAEYSQLLGLYLGDGCLSLHRKGVYALRVACDDRYPRLISEAADSIRSVHPSRPVRRIAKVGCTSVESYWKHWPCLFPQHAPGRKHERDIVLGPWQERIVEAHPGRFLRGLFNSDGCRITNWTTRPVGGEMKRYEYPRYMFSNESGDIIRLCGWALDLLGIAWRMPRPNLLSVARREAVAALDVHVGPKS
ncbi:MAG TPA: transcriptional regulator [Kribbellaceae bacterium]|nr:transcriptional regulator [Kribbellaceae bacterium]